METRANFVAIGAFTVALLAGIVVFVLWIAGFGGGAQVAQYRVVFKDSVSGLAGGGMVLFNGLRVGVVKSTHFLAEDPSKVAAIIAIDANVPVRVDTKAQLEMQGLTGVSAIALTGGAPDAAPLPHLGGDLPTLAGDASPIQDLLANVQTLSSKVDSILTRTDRFFADNDRSLTDTIKNVDNVTQSLDPAVLKKAVANVSSFAASLGNKDGAVANIGEAAKSFKILANELTVRLRQMSPGVVRFSGSGLKEYEALATDARHTLGDLDRVILSIEKHPTQLIFGTK